MRATSIILAVGLMCLGLASCQPLFLSDYLDNPAEGRTQAEVTIGNRTTYSGFFTVNSTYNSNMFFWYLPAMSGDVDAPLLLWLQGGPGASSMFGLFTEVGPWIVNDDMSLSPLVHTWNANYSMIFIDNPVGAGFSFTDNAAGFSQSQDDIATNLYSCLTQFFQIFPDLLDNDFYVTGESYAGKYIPSISYRIWQENQGNPTVRIPLVGLSIGDGALDPLIQWSSYDDLLYRMGFLDDVQANTFSKYQGIISQYIKNEQWSDAFYAFDQLLNCDFCCCNSLFTNYTGMTNYFNMLDPVLPSFTNNYVPYLQTDSIRQALHVYPYQYADYNATAELNLVNDWPQSVAPLLPTLLQNYKVMIYNGQNDITLGPAACEDFLVTLEWAGRDAWSYANKIIWMVAGEENFSGVGGYVRQGGNLTQVIVLNAGHMVPMDQPIAAFDMITRFVEDAPFTQ